MEKATENSVTIIVLTWNKLKFTKYCLYYLYKYTEYPSWDLIVIDNGSTDNTPQFLKGFQKTHENCQIILNSRNLGFAKGNNQGIKKAKGQYIVFLNNDVFVTANWLTELLNCIHSSPNIGIVGTKLLYPHNRKIQHAGIVFSLRGKPFHIFRNQKSTNIRVNIQKSYNAVTAACMLVKRSLIEELGGFDERFRIGNYEDVDLCLRARLKGYKILYCPKSEMLHNEYGSSRQIERFNEIAKRNFNVFIKKWGGLFKCYIDPALTLSLKLKYQFIETIKNLIPSRILRKLQKMLSFVFSFY